MSLPSPETWTRGMNPQQGAAVGYDLGGSVLVLAGAGSGKTTVLTRRIAYLLGHEPAAGILALTFTKDAAREMEHRLRELLGAAAATVTFPAVGTFHSFSFGLIRSRFRETPNWSRLGFAACPSLLEPAARSRWVREVRPTLGPEMSLEDLEECIRNPFAEGEPEDPGKDELDKPCDPALREGIRRRFRDYLLETGAVAFDDMTALAIRLLANHADLREDMRARFPRILVDEFQDTSRDQLELVRLLAGPEPRLFLVGDDDQAIYGFRGAEPGNIAAALEHFPGMRILKLETNYRSSAPIVAYSNGVFRDKPASLRKRLEAGRALGSAPVRTLVHRNGAEQARWMIGEMRRLRLEEGLAWRDMAVLYRLNVLEPYYRSMLAALAGPEAARETVLSTVHAAKGLEYPAVFFAGLEDGILPYRRGKEAPSPERLAEERRIFYVGVTRAQRFLYLCSCRKRILRGKSVEAEASPFLRRAPAGLSGIVRGWLRKKGAA